MASKQDSKTRTLFRRGALARRILASMLFLSLIPLIIMAAQGLHCARQAVVELEYTHLQSILAARKDRLEAWLGEREDDLRLSCFMSCGSEGCTGLMDHMSSDHFDAIRRNIDLFELDRPLYESLAVYDADWRRVGGKTGTSHDEEGSLLDQTLRAQLEGATGIVASATHPHDDEHLGLHMGYPLRRRGGETEGYIAVNVNLADTLNLILEDRTGLGEHGRLYLLSGDGTYLTCPVPGQGMIGHAARAPEAILRASTGEVVRYLNVAGVPVLGTSVLIPRFSWTLVAEVSEAEALGWMGMLGRRALTTGLVTFVAVLILATRFSRRLAGPLRQLAGTARRITGGSHQERVGDLDGSEAQDVGHAFNEMLDALDLSQQRVVQSASLAAIGELSASVVHEMRNPLSSIKINVQALRKKVADDVNYSELAHIAETQATRLERMLSELLSFGKPITLKVSTVSPAELIGEAIVGLSGTAEEKRVTVKTEDRMEGRQLQVDREQMRRALENLVRNAIEASEEGGIVVVAAKRINSEVPLAEISVRDSGPGIPPALDGKLFQPFATTRNEGTGLGLANVKKIVELHNGSVRAENLPDGGALFTLRVPYRLAEP